MEKTSVIIKRILETKGIDTKKIDVSLADNINLEEIKFIQEKPLESEPLKSLMKIAEDNDLHLMLKRSGAGISVRLSTTVNI